MSNAFTRALSTPTPQTEKNDPIQVKNNAGGFVFEVTDKTRLERFLILGTDGGTYYQNELDLTKQNLNWLSDLISRNEELVWDTVRTISDEGRAYKNSPTIMALTFLFKYGKIKDVPSTYKDDEGIWRFKKNFSYKEKTAKNLFPTVIRTFTHMSEIERYAKFLGLSGRSYRSAKAAWYRTETPEKYNGGWVSSKKPKTAESVAYQAIKYRQRDGWTHRDVVRTTHPKGLDKNVGNFILGKGIMERPERNPGILIGFTAIQNAKDSKTLLDLLSTYTMLPWEAIPTKFLKEPDVWKKLFYNGQLKGQALVRNITRLARIGAFNDMVFAADYAAKLTDEEMIQKTRLHPINYLNALVVHQEGQVDRERSGGWSFYTNRKPRDWTTVPVIVDALNAGFHLAFKHTEPANKRTLIGLDVSGSMASPASGLELSCSQVAAAMAMSIAKTEPYYMVRGFSDSLKDLGIAPSMDLATIVNKTGNMTMGRTDCALPMVWASKNNVEIDTFVVLTDNETWYGNKHPYVALQEYRKKTGINARLVVAAMTATPFSIADPRDPGMLDIVGADSNLPKLVAEFSAGRI